MINPNFNSIQASGIGLGQASEAVSPVRNTFQNILAQVAERPLKPVGVQQFAGVEKRSLAYQVHSDTAEMR